MPRSTGVTRPDRERRIGWQYYKTGAIAASITHKEDKKEVTYDQETSTISTDSHLSRTSSLADAAKEKMLLGPSLFWPSHLDRSCH
jgi:hypothetical protein